MSEVAAAIQKTLNAALSAQSNQMHTAIPCIVVAVRESLTGAMVDIQPTVNQRFKDNTTKERPVILGVPVSFPVSTTAGFTFPIEVGSTGIAIFSMRNLDAWKNSTTGRPTTPLNFAKFDKGDAMFIPGIQPPGMSVNNPEKRKWQHSTKDAVLVNNIGTGSECEVRLKPSGDVVINTDFNVEVNCKNANITATQDITLACVNLDVTATTATFDIGTTTWLGNTTHTGNYTINGTLMFNGINFATHKHTGVQSGPSLTGAPTS
ncbi:MAG: Gp138 family membrane-puncturing spike protein [Bacteroidales bacterium]